MLFYILKTSPNLKYNKNKFIQQIIVEQLSFYLRKKQIELDPYFMPHIQDGLKNWTLKNYKDVRRKSSQDGFGNLGVKEAVLSKL